MARASELQSTNLRITNRQVVQARANLARKAGDLLARLNRNAMGTLTTNARNESGEIIRDAKGNAVRVPYEMTMGQIRSAEIVLRKIVPDLQSVNISEDKQEASEQTKEQLLLRLQTLLLSPSKRLLLLCPAPGALRRLTCVSHSNI